MKESNTTKPTATLESRELDWEKFLIIKKALAVNKTLPLRIIGDSMKPLIQEGDLLNVHYLESYQTLKRFDIIVFWTKDMLICHYYWRKNQIFTDEKDITIVTRPLNPYKGYDYPIQPSQILGIVTEKELSFWNKCLAIYFRKK